MHIGDIKDFIKLNNDDALMDQSFASVKRSVYGHIGYVCQTEEFFIAININYTNSRFFIVEQAHAPVSRGRPIMWSLRLTLLRYIYVDTDYLDQWDKE